jgi:hypothetical protein
MAPSVASTSQARVSAMLLWRAVGRQKVRGLVDSSGITFIQNFVEIGQFVQKFKWILYRQTAW